MNQDIRATEHVRIDGGAIVRRSAAALGHPGNHTKQWFARHDRGPPQYDANTHTCRRIDSIAMADEEVKYEVIPKPINDVRFWAFGAIDSAADDCILSGRSQGAGIAVAYDMQRQEMLDYLAAKSAGQATPSASYPLMTALVGLQGADLDAVAETIRQRVTAEASRIATINAARLSAKASIAGAGSVDQIASIVASARAAIEAA